MVDLNFSGRNVLYVDLGAILQNLVYLENLSGSRAIPVIKADGYGLGAVPIARFLESKGYSLFAVASYEEAMEVRDSGVTGEILILSGSPDDPYEEFERLNFSPVIYSREQVERLSKISSLLDVHIKVDTGMNRLGFDDVEDVLPLFRMKNLRIRGIMTHFAKADSSLIYTKRQLKIFSSFLRNLPLSEDITVHTSNSAAVLRGLVFGNMIRPGIYLYGALPNPRFPRPAEQLIPYTYLCKILQKRRLKRGDRVSYGGTFVARRDMDIAVVSCGYADGVPRKLSNRGFFYVKKKRVPMIGRVCMDMSIVDVTGVSDIGVGDTVMYLGKYDGVILSADHVAQLTGTIGYEILTSINSRVKRVHYVGF